MRADADHPLSPASGTRTGIDAGLDSDADKHLAPGSHGRRLQGKIPHMNHLLAQAWKPGARIFVAVGRDHVPAQAAALRCAQ
jgi:hypothetical protein